MLGVIHAIRRRGVLTLLVILPNGSRSLIPAAWTDWRATEGTAGGSAVINDVSALGRLDDLCRLRAVLDGLLRRRCESASPEENADAVEDAVSRDRRSVRTSAIGAELGTDEPTARSMGSDRRSGSGRSPRRARALDRPHAGRARRDGGAP